MQNVNEIEEKVLNWKSLAGYTYLLICLFDFVAMPFAMHMINVEKISEMSEILEDHNADKEVVLRLVDKVEVSSWEPTTLTGGGLFHLSFGAILAGATVTRGMERREIFKQGNNTTE